MNINLRLIVLFLIVPCLFQDMSAEDNVKISSRTISCRLKAKSGRLSSVKLTDQRNYTAERVDEEIVAIQFYNEDITIDKASAPGATPIYRAWEDEDIFFSGSRVCVLPVKVKKGKDVKAVFEQTYKTPEQFCQIMLAEYYIVENTLLSITVPPELRGSLSFEPLNLPEETKITSEINKDGELVYFYEIPRLRELSYEPHAVSADISAPQILVKGYFRDVNELYAFLRSENPSDSGEALRKLASELCAGKSDPIEKIDTISSWVRNNIRYVAVEHGEYGIRPESADAVLEKRYGDCKGSANLIKSLLKAAGIDGRLVWIGTRGQVAFNWTDFPSLAAGNHMIAAAVLPDSTIFIDGTVSFAPKGYCPPSIAGRQCLVENGPECIVDTVPPLGPDVNYISLSATCRIEGKNLESETTAVFRGSERVGLENSLASISSPKRIAFLESLLSAGRKSARQSDISCTTAGPDAETTSVKYQETDPASVRALSGGKTYVFLRPLRFAAMSRYDANKRRRPVAFYRECSYFADILFSIPEGYRIEKLPEEKTVSCPWFKGSVRYSMENGKVKVSSVLRTIPSVIQPDSIKHWNEAIAELEKASNSPIIILPES